MQTMIRLFKSEDGATAIEYALIAALVSIVAIVAMGSVGNSVTNSFSKVASTLTSANR
ncbi:MAG: Flp family type IVb pilin [Rickettsiales bacterium]|jgi:pilus assembly protein Flp/PilA